MKLHDIENTVAKGVESVAQARRDVSHRARLSADHEGRGRGAAGLGPEDARRDGAHLLRRHRSRARPAIRTNVEALVARRAQQAHDLGIDGLVCSPEEASPLRLAVGNDMLFVTPGIRPVGAAHGDQKRVATPTQAIDAGADYLVVGPADHGARPIRRPPPKRSSPRSPRGRRNKQETEDACRKATGSGASM